MILRTLDLLGSDPRELVHVKAVVPSPTTGGMALVSEILRGSDHALTIFKPEAVASLNVYLKGSKPYLKCYATGRERPAKPEEIVRQLYIHKLVNDYGYPIERIAVEKPVQFGSAVHHKAADIVVWDKHDPTAAFIIVECKKPKRADGLEQLKSYCHAEGAPIGVWTNGAETIILHRRHPNYFQRLPDLPRADQTLSDLLGERWRARSRRAGARAADADPALSRRTRASGGVRSAAAVGGSHRVTARAVR